MEKLGFAKGMTDNNLYSKEVENGLLVILIFVYDIFFGGNDKESDNFLKEMKNKFEMSMIGEMNFFLGLQIVWKIDGIFISHSKYLNDLLKMFGL